MKSGQKVVVKQTRSTSSRDKRATRVLEALGLGGIGKSRVVTLNPATVGMINRVGHLVSIVDKVDEQVDKK